MIITMQDLLKAGAHFGHKTKDCNPKMKKYIYGINNKLHIFNLEFTFIALKNVRSIIKQITKKNKKILFVGTKQAASSIISEESTKVYQPFVTTRWLGGMLTNYKTIRQSKKKLSELELMRSNGMLNKLTKKEVLLNNRKLHKLETCLGGIKNMSSLPEALFVIDVTKERIAIKEANKLGILVIGVVDTNSNPDGIDYIIPGNDDSINSIKIYTKLIANYCK
ncbi:30S ribosomal protein S2 [Candidatus Portiera aleyrodidarum]|uniref:Small ribosomal subunit protein uS2 n=1 Tax=Candidatus Portiera aleyrodidarum MED (Bemisia tabaci) TaxID=1163752 RepID=A0AAU8RSH8_9GAMM|nr:30S ribosomal protein S2 [Candidatus Portiera aleyrodidarum]AFQ24138.1 ribosomal protein S2 [Candidatus Portiera aleyrodidarum BT-B-HRs]AFS18900.1 30S ribosomal protein S2 [Candidatus Portiera aleyrodidarum BT-QVLC]AFT80534.1 SSU ribosomal protein S2p (SAe) [Candidatus Portiera aleyrodidarum BT-QVLC]AJF24113.1 30S ribosomal protein S2 [Candidatus Portiera aleyrodidarum MED (Bemisia tabaci)]ASX27303.1 30S ribosomal protein S2 [Candidatus Portiera aleyrodidarum MED (Bemisia tabaci)]